MEPTKKLFLERLQSVRAELQAITQTLLPEVGERQSDRVSKTIADVTIAQLCGITNFYFRLEPGHDPSWRELKVTFVSREVEDNDSDIEISDFGDY